MASTKFTTDSPTERGDAYRAVRLIYDKSPGRSWSREVERLQATLLASEATDGR